MIKIIPILLVLSPPMWWPLLPATWTSPWWKKAAWIGSPIEMERTVFALIGDCDTSLLVSSHDHHRPWR